MGRWRVGALFAVAFLALPVVPADPAPAAHAAHAGPVAKPRPPLPAVLGGKVWYDRDKDGIRSPYEDPIPGVTVNLLDRDGNALYYPPNYPAVTTTDSDGNYSFTVNARLSYRLRFDPRTADTSRVADHPSARDLLATMRLAGGDSERDSDPNPDSLTAVVSFAARRNAQATGAAPAGLDDLTVDAGFFRAQLPTLRRFVNDKREHVANHIVPLGSKVTLHYLITNRDDDRLTEVEVNDDVLGLVACPATHLAAHATMTCSATATAQPGQDSHAASLSGRVRGAPITPVSVTGGIFTQVSVRIRKVDRFRQGTPLRGAVFEVRDGAASGATVATLTTGTDGTAVATGLDAGPRDRVEPKRYCLVEMRPPKGYQREPEYLDGQCASTSLGAPVLTFSVGDPPVERGFPALGMGSAGGPDLPAAMTRAWLILGLAAFVLFCLGYAAHRSHHQH